MQEGYWIIKQSFAGIRLTRWQMTKLLATQLWRELPPGALTVIVLAGSLALAWAVSTIFLRPAQPSLDKLGIPLVGKSKGRKMNFEQLLEESAKKVCLFGQYLEPLVSVSYPNCFLARHSTLDFHFGSKPLDPSTSSIHRSTLMRSSVCQPLRPRPSPSYKMLSILVGLEFPVIAKS